MSPAPRPARRLKRHMQTRWPTLQRQIRRDKILLRRVILPLQRLIDSIVAPALPLLGSVFAVNVSLLFGSAPPPLFVLLALVAGTQPPRVRAVTEPLKRQKKRVHCVADAARWIPEQVRDDGETGSLMSNNNVRKMPPPTATTHDNPAPADAAAPRPPRYRKTALPPGPRRYCRYCRR